MPGQEEPTKEEREMSIGEMRNVVKEVLAEEQEKDKTSEQLGNLNSKIGELSKDLAGMKKLFCAEDGTVCFASQEELDRYMRDQKARIEALGNKIGDVVAKIKDLAQPQKPVPQGGGRPRKKWGDMNPDERGVLLQEMDKLGYPHPAHYELVRECSVSGKKDACDMLGSALKEYRIEEIIEKLPEQKRRGVMAFVCKDGTCKPLREGMEKEEGIRIYVKDKRGKWVWADEPEPKPYSPIF